MPVAFTSQTVRVAARRVSLTDEETYYFDFDGLTTPPDVIDAVQQRLEEDTEYTDVLRQVRTVRP